ncbi:MAG TPA: dihydroneopterin aldolase [Acidobacteriota bacterium]|nr:dihydroneopterin aldolase [Acidobacteriota bacterium]
MRLQESRIILRGIRLYSRIGATQAERSTPQECRADLTLWGGFEEAAVKDSLDATTDYCAVLVKVQEIACEREYVLLESLAFSIVQKIINEFPVLRVGIRLQKRPEILINDLDFVEVAIDVDKSDE